MQGSAGTSCGAWTVVGHVLLELLFVVGKLCQGRLCAQGLVESSVCVGCHILRGGYLQVLYGFGDERVELR